MNKIVLGSSQFGMQYGIKNSNSRVHIDEIVNILQVAVDHEINEIDTAMTYGDAEETLGKLDTKTFLINSKLPSPPNNILKTNDWVIREISNSLTRLQRDKIETLFIHDPKWLLLKRDKHFLEGLISAKESGIIKKIGVSINQISDIPNLFKLHNFDVLQAPLNIINRNLQLSGWLNKLKVWGVEVQVRSLFLQGLLLMEAKELPVKFNRWKNMWEHFEQQLRIEGTNAVCACISYPKSLNDIDKFVIGVDSASQLLEIIRAFKSNRPQDHYSFMQSTDEDLINPSLWNSL